MEHNGAFAHSVHRVGSREESSRVIVPQGVQCDCSSKFSYGIQCRHDLAINLVFDLGKFKDPERWKLRLLELSSDTGSFVCPVGDLDSKKLDSNGSNTEFDGDNDRAVEQAVLHCDDGEVDGLSCNDEPFAVLF